jgi:acetyl-CoA carboxylase carboxyltransferase component
VHDYRERRNRKAGAFFPATAKKLIRAQRIAFECALPLVYLVDSAGVFRRCKTRSFRMKTILAGSFATTP